MKSYSLRISGREEGPYAEAQIAQFFADGRIDRNTPCKPANGGEWKSIDDYLPMLKYGTQLPPPVDIRSVPTNRRRYHCRNEYQSWILISRLGRS